MMANKAKAKGTSFEVLVRDYLIDKGFIHAHRPALSGGNDTGDVNGIARRDTLRKVAVQCNNQKYSDHVHHHHYYIDQLYS
jgi:hypothetical protein